MKKMAAAAFAVILLSAAAVSCRRSSPNDRNSTQTPQSILLITLDTTRADRLGCYGGKGNLTPSLDRLARRSYLFEHCETAIPQTMPSHTTIFSGWNPYRHGVRKNLGVVVPAAVPLLAPEFEKAGYRTAAFVSSFVLLGRYGLGRGFETYDDGFYDPRFPERTDRRAQDTLAAAQRWIQSQRGRWFCWIHLYDPHVPYRPPEPWSSRFASSPYDGEIAYMDDELGLFLEALERTGIMRKTLVVVCGDHGECLGEHGEETHGIFLYEAATHVPLLIHLPGEQKPARLPQTVGLVDIAPTVRSLCGLAPAPGDGRSLAPLMKGRPWTSQPVYIESLDSLYSFGWAPLYALAEGPWKYILAPKPELYNVSKDPEENRNLVRKEPRRAAAMKKILEKDLQQRTATKGEAVQLDESEMRSLQSLGYISGTMGTGSGGGYRDPKDMTAFLQLYERAMDAYNQGRMEEAERGFQALAGQDPGNPLTYFYLGNILGRTDPDRAELYFKKCLKLRPDFWQGYSQLMLLWVNTGKMQQAFDLGKAAIARGGDPNGTLHVLRAWAAYGLHHDRSEIESDLTEAARIAPEAGLSLKLRAVLALQDGTKKEAVGFLERMAKVAPPKQIALLSNDPRFKPLAEDQHFWLLVLTARQEIRDESGRH
ncbi:MAG: sulfatase-like hydrolase/transferase [Acidobacteriota bacterium]